MTTVVVFVPLAFIQGLVGSFFLPFALTVTFALIASLFVALTAVPVLGAYLLRPGDLPEGAGEEGEIRTEETWMQRAYIAILRWVLGHRLLTMLVAVLLTVSSLGLTAIIPVNLFGGGGDRFLQIELALPPGAPVSETLVSGDRDRGPITRCGRRVHGQHRRDRSSLRRRAGRPRAGNLLRKPRPGCP